MTLPPLQTSAGLLMVMVASGVTVTVMIFDSAVPQSFPVQLYRAL